MFPCLPGSSSSNSGSSATPSVSMPSNAIVGDLLIVVVSENGDATSSDNNGSEALAKDAEQTGLGGGNGITIYSKYVDGSEPSTLNFTLTSSQRWAIVSFLVKNVNQSTKYDVAPVSTGNHSEYNTSTYCPSINTTVNNTIAIAVANIDGSRTFNTYPSGYTEIATVQTQQPVSIYYKPVSTPSSTGNATFTKTGAANDSIGMVQFSIKPSTIKSPFPTFFRSA